MNKALDIYTWSVSLSIFDYAAGKSLDRELTVRARTEEDAIRKARRQWDASPSYSVTHAVTAPITIAN